MQGDLFAPLLDELGEKLLRLHRTGKVAQKDEAVLIAHGLAYDPHVDGRLRLTPPGRKRAEL